MTMRSCSLPSPAPTPASPSATTQLHTFVVLTKKSSARRCSSRASLTSSSSTCSTDSSDDEADEPEDDACVAYESYAAVAARSAPPSVSPRRQLRWSDLAMQPRAPGFLARSTRRSALHRDSLVFHALELCFEFLDLRELQTATLCCTAFRDVVGSSARLLSGLYSRQWRVHQRTLPRVYVTLAFRDQLVLCARRRADARHVLSTRSAVTPQPDGTSRVLNNSMLRSFAHGAVDSIRTLEQLPELSCARALHRHVSYYEVRLTGSGSVGVAALSDAATRDAYGFGSAEHVGWKPVSYGYHGNDGDFVYNDGARPYGGAWEPFGPAWSPVAASTARPTHTVGCGLDADKRRVFFTLDGRLIGLAPVDVLPGAYAAAVSLQGYGDSAVLNLGSAAFVYDIEGFCASP